LYAISLSLSFVQGFAAADSLFLHILFNECFRYWDSPGEGAASKVEGLHLTGARAIVLMPEKALCAARNQEGTDYVKTHQRIPKISLVHSCLIRFTHGQFRM
jgi:hypothetical protein